MPAKKKKTVAKGKAKEKAPEVPEPDNKGYEYRIILYDR